MKTAFLDLLFNCVLGFMLLFIIAFALVKIESEKAKIVSQAEFVITVTWSSESADDVDSWLRDPAGGIVWFGHLHEGLAHLDRDDLGITSDSIVLPDGTSIAVKYNQEITSIRGFVPGTWVFNLHMYRKTDLEPVTVIVKVEKLNPTVKLIYRKEVTLSKTGEEVTILSFDTDIHGNVLAVDTNSFVDLVNQKLLQVHHGVESYM